MADDDDKKKKPEDKKDKDNKKPPIVKPTTGLGEIIKRHLINITPAIIDSAIEEAHCFGKSLPSVLAERGLATEDDLVRIMSKEFGFPSVDLRNQEITRDVLGCLSEVFMRKHGIVPIDKSGGKLVVAVPPTLDSLLLMDDIKFTTNLEPEFVFAPREDIERILEKYLIEDTRPDAEDLFTDLNEADVEILREGDLDEGAEEISQDIVRLANLLLLDAIRKGASDIHIEPFEKYVRIRYRIDGQLHFATQLPADKKASLTARFKIMCNMKIDEKRLPQDGRIGLTFGKDGKKRVDFRVSCLPTRYGEKIVLRILDASALQIDMTALGMEQEQLTQFKRAIHAPWGMVLVTGPTGSGKTTTLYSALMELNKMSDNISTVEDPVEIDMEGVNQVQVDDKIGMTFAEALRSFLRQDPDIIMLGEVRDFETAEIAIKAALTGHLVLSTLHTNDAPSTISRLLNMGIEPFLVTSSVNLILAQRLVRKICQKCRQPVIIASHILQELGIKPEEAEKLTFYEGKGCPVCNDTGYKGRTAIYEILVMTEEMREAVTKGYNADELRKLARASGLMTLREAGNAKFRAGITSAEEVLTNTFAN